MGGQNTALSLLCASGAAAALARRKDVLAGVWLGAWMFKPQLALPVTVVVAIAGHPKVVAGATISAATLYLAGAAISEPTWPIWWVRDILLPYAAAGLPPDPPPEPLPSAPLLPALGASSGAGSACRRSAGLPLASS